MKTKNKISHAELDSKTGGCVTYNRLVVVGGGGPGGGSKNSQRLV